MKETRASGISRPHSKVGFPFANSKAKNQDSGLNPYEAHVIFLMLPAAIALAMGSGTCVLGDMVS